MARLLGRLLLASVAVLATAGRAAARDEAFEAHVQRPAPGAFVDTCARVEVYAFPATGARIATITATIEGRSAALREDEDADYGGCVNLTGLPRGSKTLTVDVRDTAGHHARFQVPVILDALPHARVTSPLPYTVYLGPTARLTASCTDDLQNGCTHIRAFVNDTVVAEGTSSIDAVVSLDSVTPDPFLSEQVAFETTDASGQVNTERVPVYVERAPVLTEVARAPGPIYDADATRLLFRSADWTTIAVQDRVTGRTTPILTSGAVNTDEDARLAPGAVLIGYGRDLLEWRGGLLTRVASFDGRLVVRGGYAAWFGHDAQSPGDNTVVYLRDVVRRITYRVDDGLDPYDWRLPVSILASPVALTSAGVVTYWKASSLGADIWQYAAGRKRQLTNAPPQVDGAPQADGSVLVYQRNNLGTDETVTMLRVAGGETPLARWATGHRPYAGSDYGVADGYVAYTTDSAIPSDKELWIRMPDRTTRRASTLPGDKSLDGIGPLGAVTFTHFVPDPTVYDLMAIWPGREARRIATGRASPLWIGGQLHVRLGRSLLRVATPPAPRLVTTIDLPVAESVSTSFVVAGWAVDTGAASSCGVDVVQVYAYADTGSAIYLGTAAGGGARPDVAAQFGSAFTNCGYGLRVSSLAPGHYRLAVFAHSRVSNAFAPAAVRDITVAP